MTRLYGVLAAVMLCGQLAHGQDLRRPFGPPPGPPVAGCDGRTIVLIASGASEYLDLQDRLNDATENNPFPICMRVINWATLEYTSYNYQGQGVQVLGAARMAAQVLKIRQCNPGTPIVLMGHCAGARVVLLAAEQLPPGSVDRIILLSPAVTAWYDPRLALRASRCGIDMYYSSDDPNLQDKENYYGSSEGLPGPTAGRIGFLIKCKGPLANDPILLGLRQSNVAGCDFLADIGEYTTLNRSFLRRYIVPLIPFGAICGFPGGPLPPAGPLVPPPGPPVPPQGPYGPQLPPPPGGPIPPLMRNPPGPGPMLPPVLPAPPLNRATGPMWPTPPVSTPVPQGPSAPISDRGPVLPPPPVPSSPLLPPPPTN